MTRVLDAQGKCRNLLAFQWAADPCQTTTKTAKRPFHLPCAQHRGGQSASEIQTNTCRSVRSTRGSQFKADYTSSGRRPLCGRQSATIKATLCYVCCSWPQRKIMLGRLSVQSKSENSLESFLPSKGPSLLKLPSVCSHCFTCTFDGLMGFVVCMYMYMYIYIYVVKLKSGPKFALFKVKKWSNFLVSFFCFRISRSPCRKKRILKNNPPPPKKKLLKLKSGPIMLRNIIGPLFNFRILYFFVRGGGLKSLFL